MEKIKEQHRLLALMAKRDAKRSEFVRTDADTYQLFAPKYAVLKKETKEAWYVALYAAVGYGILWLLFYKHLENTFVFILAILLGLVVIGFVVKAIILKRARDFVYHDWQSSMALDNVILEESIALNHQAAATAIGIMCLTENDFELSCIKDEEALVKRWKILVKAYTDTIDAECNHRATIDDYLSIYERWERMTAEIE